jgi:broad specificity phosphatase PhoE
MGSRCGLKISRLHVGSLNRGLKTDHGVVEEATYPTETVEKMETAKTVITSDLKRSMESARLLNPNRTAISDPLFREIGLPFPFSNVLGLKLPANLWAVVLRCLWFCGYSSQSESFSEAKTRAEKASKELVKYAEEHQHIVLVGHGFMNRIIAKELKKMGWKGKKTANSRHWNATTYSFEQ